MSRYTHAGIVTVCRECDIADCHHLRDRQRQAAKPDCPLCGGKGWTLRRIEIAFIGGVEAVPCKCTEGACHE